MHVNCVCVLRGPLIQLIDSQMAFIDGKGKRKNKNKNEQRGAMKRIGKN